MIWHLAEIWLSLAVSFALGGFAGSLLQRYLATTRLAGAQTAFAYRIRLLVDRLRRLAGERTRAVFSQPGARTDVVRAVAVTAEPAAAPAPQEVRAAPAEPTPEAPRGEEKPAG